MSKFPCEMSATEIDLMKLLIRHELDRIEKSNQRLEQITGFDAKQRQWSLNNSRQRTLQDILYKRLPEVAV